MNAMAVLTAKSASTRARGIRREELAKQQERKRQLEDEELARLQARKNSAGGG